jgi:hypothetical protein
MVLAAKGDPGPQGLPGTPGTNGTNGAGYGGSSATSLTIGTGSKTFTGVATTLAYQISNYVRASSAANGANYQEGFITAYGGGSLTINVTKIGGAGTFADWNFAPAGAPGTGDVSSTNNLSELANKDTALSTLRGVSYGASQALTPTQQDQAQKNIGLPAVMRNYLAGLTLSAAGGSASFGIAAGDCVDSTGAALMRLGSAYTKSTGAWSVGSGGSALDTGVIAANTWYHVYIIERLDTGVVDVLISLSATAPTMPANYTVFRRVGSIRTDVSSLWIAFLQNGDEFIWSVPVNNNNNTALTTTNQSPTLTVPTGVIVNAIFNTLFTSASAGAAALWYQGGLAVQAAGVPAANYQNVRPRR